MGLQVCVRMERTYLFERVREGDRQETVQDITIERKGKIDVVAQTGLVLYNSVLFTNYLNNTESICSHNKQFFQTSINTELWGSN